jgi:hypothetical protein
VLAKAPCQVILTAPPASDAPAKPVRDGAADGAAARDGATPSDDGAAR